MLTRLMIPRRAHQLPELLGGVFEYASYFSALFAQIPLELFAALTVIMRVVFIFEVDAAAQRVKASA
jgi:hypothetical protein